MIFSFLILLLNFTLQQDTVPYKPKTDFELIFNYELKHREGIGGYDEVKKHSKPVYWGEGSESKSGYFTVDLKVKTLSTDEVQYRLIDIAGKPVTSQKIRTGHTIHLTLGFIEDMKKGLVPNGYKIIFYSRKKVDISQIEIRVLDDGAYIVNGEYHLFLPHRF